MTEIPYRHHVETQFLAPGMPERIHAAALRILEEVGLAVSSQEARAQLEAMGWRTSGERVFVPSPDVELYLERRRRRHAGEQRPASEADDGLLYLSPGMYAHHMHDLEQDRIVPYTCAALIEMTKFVDVLTERRVYGSAPGYPLDVAPALQPIAKYRIGALYSRHGLAPVDPISAASLPYVIEMAEALGNTMDHLPVYVFSPLRLAGESLQVVLRYRDRLKSVHVGSMPSLGGTCPVLPFGALAMTVAEVIGGAAVLEAVTELPVEFGVGLHAFDLRFGSMIFGSPESYLLGQISAEINEYYSPWRTRGRGNASAGIHVRANFPGAQAAAEKASLMTAGALAGARWFDGAGILAVDEVFSAEQLLVDCDTRDMVQRLIGGVEMGEALYDWVDEVRRGVENSFMTLDSTLDEHRRMYWYPRLFERGFLAGHEEGRLRLAERARDMVRTAIAQHSYEPEAHVRRTVEAVWQRACRELA